MRAVVTRVKSASVEIGGKVNGAIGQGYLVLLGVGPNDTEDTAVKLADKICNLRVFEDENGKMNRNLEQVGGGVHMGAGVGAEGELGGAAAVRRDGGAF